MAKIKVKNPVVEMDGDEMTRIIWQLIKDKLIHPYLDIDLLYYDLSVQNRDETNDQITIDAANKTREVGVAVKCATITPDEGRVKEFGLKEMWRSPNGTIRNILGGTIFREPIICKNVPRLVPGWTKPIIIGRHAYRRPVSRDRLQIPRQGHADHQVHRRRRQGDRAAKCSRRPAPASPWRCTISTTRSATSRSASFNYGLNRGYSVYLSTKNTILKQYDGRFMELFQEIFDKDFKVEVPGEGHHLRASPDRRHGGRGAEMVRRLCLGLQELRRRRAVRHGGAGLRLARPDDLGADDAGRQGGGSRSRPRHGDAPLSRSIRRARRPRPTRSPRSSPGRAASPIAPSSTTTPQLAKFASTLEKVCVDTVESGFMTKDLALLVGPEQKWLSTTGFLDKIDENLKKAMAA